MLDADGEDCGVEDCAVEDCAVEDWLADACGGEAGAGDAGAAAAGAEALCPPAVCAKHPTAHHAIATPSKTARPTAVPQSMSLAARDFIRHSNRAASMRNPRVPHDYTSVNVLEVYSPSATPSIRPTNAPPQRNLGVRRLAAACDKARLASPLAAKPSSKIRSRQPHADPARAQGSKQPNARRSSHTASRRPSGAKLASHAVNARSASSRARHASAKRKQNP